MYLSYLGAVAVFGAGVLVGFLFLAVLWWEADIDALRREGREQDRHDAGHG